MPNFITNTSIVDESWNARGLITHNAVTKALVRADDGTLWAAVREDHTKQYINIYKSADGGFSWSLEFRGDFLNTNRRTGLSGLNQNGPFMHLTLSEERSRLILWHSFYDATVPIYNLEPYIFDIGENGLTRLTETADHAVTGITLDADELAVDVSYTSGHVFLTYVSVSELNIKVYNHTYQTSVTGFDSTGDAYFNIFGTHANDNNTLDIVILKDDSPTYTLEYLQWTRSTSGSDFSTPVTIDNFPATDVADINVERDGQGNLLAFWNQESTDGTTTSQRYALSLDNGTTWDIETVPYTANQTDFTDLATGRLSGRTVAMGGLQGFLIGYVRLLSGTPVAFLRTLLWDGVTYVLGDEIRAVDVPCTGIRFFRPTGNQMTDLDQLGEVRIAYMVGEATSQVQVDTSPVRFGQHLLREAEAFDTEAYDYGEDIPLDNEVLVTFNLLGAVSENIDYFNVGLIGPVTKKYMGAFDKVGTVVNLYRYEPTPEAESSDRSAYGAPVVTSIKVVVEPINYDFPVVTGNESFTTYIERDTRKIHVPPNHHLGRTFLVNAGNHLKRTVWLFQFDGNEYEISQVVPRFLKDQIAYYEANGYVVGPSNNPFSRTILPSET